VTAPSARTTEMRPFALVVLALAVGHTSLNPLHGAEVLYEKQSRYHFIRVLESEGIRTLTFRRRGYDRNQSRVDVGDPLRLCLPYYPLMFAGYLFVPKPQRVLVVGLGGGVVSRLSAHYFPEAQVDSIELDPDVVQVAKKFFGFEEGEKQRVFVRDARVQVRVFRSEQAIYDIIMLDAFRGGFVPYHLTTKEFFQECRDILSPDGAFVVNLKPNWIIYQYQRRTLASVFSQQYPFGGAADAEVVVALPSPRETTRDQLLVAATALQERRKFSFRLRDVASQYNIGPVFSEKGAIFTDDHVPANILKRQLEDSHTDYVLPAPAFERLAAWLRANRIPIISLAVVSVLVAATLRRARRARSLRKMSPGRKETGET